MQQVARKRIERKREGKINIEEEDLLSGLPTACSLDPFTPSPRPGEILSGKRERDNQTQKNSTKKPLIIPLAISRFSSFPSSFYKPQKTHRNTH